MHHEKFRHPPPPKEDQAGEKKPTEEEEDDACEAERAAKRLKIGSSSAEKEVEEEEKEEEDAGEGDEGGGVAPSKIAEDDVVKPSENEEMPAAVVEEDGDLVPEQSEWPSDAKESVEQKYLTSMPDDFMAFWAFCGTQNRDNPREALVHTCGLRLVGPFDIVAGDMFATRKLNDFLCHWRYYRDPAEFQTLLAAVDEGNNFHMGYYRDAPREKPAFVAAMGGSDEAARDGYKFVIMGDNLFGALYNHVTQLVAKAEPFRQTALVKLKEAIHFHATMKNQVQTHYWEVPPKKH